jgi:hypothetical protein
MVVRHAGFAGSPALSINHSQKYGLAAQMKQIDRSSSALAS